MNAKAKPPVEKVTETVEMGSGIRPRATLPLAGTATGAVTVWAAA